MTKSKKYLAEQIGQCIAKRRLAAGFTQHQVAEKLGIGYEAVSRMERGVTIPTVIRLADLAEIFGCGIQELLIESSDRPDEQAEQIKNMLAKLNSEDRNMILETIQKLYLRLKP
nr:helix-turn-helix transcriptional regulator [uncultured Methylotenera sp.]